MRQKVGFLQADTFSPEGMRNLPEPLTKALVPSSTSRKSWRRTPESVRCMTSAYKGTGETALGEIFQTLGARKRRVFRQAISHW